MKRRSFLKSLGAIGLAPFSPSLPVFNAQPTATSTIVAKDTYMWAETIVRAHNYCNLGMLQRLLKLDKATASALKSELLKNGVISAQANAYGIHTAIKPLFDGTSLRSHKPIEKLAQSAKKFVQQDPKTDNPLSKITHENKQLEEVSDLSESKLQRVDSISNPTETKESEEENPSELT